ncbi:unnamed protein product [Microthlaspi erraticum]|uniref:Uncharacterized protein n=1 Tax=Microthlaspi erraticum TaxID=1685480 RepID=A0A6D2I7E5_9BRAS|nr:unnamed protein product [Microthlaspi erraticum]
MYSLIIHGRRLVELQKCRNLRAFVNPFQNVFAFSNSFSSASATASAEISLRDGRKEKTFTVSYLVESLGLARKLAESISKKVSFEEKGNADSVLSLLRSHGFTDSQISTIITTYPRLLIADSEKSLAPKLQFLQSRGASSSELTEIVSKVPKILGIKKEKALSRYYDYVKEIVKADKSSKFETLCHSSLPQGRAQENIIRNVLVLRELGVPQKLLLPLLISKFQPVCGKEKFRESLKKVVELGFDPTTFKFVEALQVVYGLKEETVEEKISVYESLGLTVSDVWSMFKKWPNTLAFSEKKITQKFEILKKCGLVEDEVRSVFKSWPIVLALSEKNILNTIETFLGLGFSRDEVAMIAKSFPQCIGLSAEKMKKKVEFLVKKMDWPLKAVVTNPAVLGNSMEKRIVPRCNVIKALLSRGLLSELPPISSSVICVDEVFLKRFVRKLDDKELVAELIAILSEKKKKKKKKKEETSE